jgi:methionyl-tRNA formyltransferase
VEPGKVVSVENNRIIIKTGDGLIKIIDHEFERCPDVGEYL